ncbi:hypothetical protein FLACOL_01583 [Flavobacterium columnare]|uniref:Uncharacterized protein n=2 Tax=Flavobacterium TaxID=237 RepID=A0ABW8PL30_9FLAO|nr:hypothetical protein [Flavobacterium columnare]SPE77587.1 hypothetical protein FLACOL_01583 [Flavobacterium columnare]
MKKSEEEILKKLNNAVVEEIYSEMTEELAKLSNDPIISYCLNIKKYGIGQKFSSRIVNHWTNAEVVMVELDDLNKNKRFTRLDLIWMHIADEARNFGLPLKVLAKTRDQLFDSPIPNFSVMKYHVLETLLGNPKMLIIYESGSAVIMNYENYASLASKGLFMTHISLKLEDFIKKEFENNTIDEANTLEIENSSIEAKLLYYFILTNDYISMKIKVNESDFRLVENSKQILTNDLLLNCINQSNFKSIEIVIDKDHTILIEN